MKAHFKKPQSQLFIFAFPFCFYMIVSFESRTTVNYQGESHWWGNSKIKIFSAYWSSIKKNNGAWNKTECWICSELSSGFGHAADPFSCLWHVCFIVLLNVADGNMGCSPLKKQSQAKQQNFMNFSLNQIPGVTLRCRRPIHLWSRIFHMPVTNLVCFYVNVWGWNKPCNVTKICCCCRSCIEIFQACISLCGWLLRSASVVARCALPYLIDFIDFVV